MYDYELIRSKRKSISLEITRDCKIVVRAPLKTDENSIKKFVCEHTHWIDEHLPKQKKRQEKYACLTPQDIEAMRKKAKEVIPPTVNRYADIMGLKPKSIKITSAKSRLGSCGSDGSVCFSLYLMLYPRQVIEYVAVHELAHIKHHNHSKSFYSLIEQYMPDYKDRIALMKRI